MTRKLYYALACLALGFPLATFNVQAQNAANSSSISESNAAAGARNTNNFNSKGTLQAPSIGVPGLTASVQTCLGSTSFGVSGAGFGFGFGTTYRAKHCETILNAQILRALGKKNAAVQSLCYRKELAGALQATGTRCDVGRHRQVATLPALQPRTARNGRTLPEPTRTANTPSGPYWWTGQCKPRQQFILINNQEKPCR